MRVSLTNLVNQVFFKKNHSDVFTKLIFFNKSLNPSFSGKIESLSESFFLPNLEIFHHLFELFNKLGGKKDKADLVHAPHFEYINNLIYLSLLENDPDFFDQLDNEEEKETAEQTKLNLERFKGEFLEFFEENFEKQNEMARNFLQSFRNFEFDEEFNSIMGDESLISDENFYSKYLLKIAQIVFSDYTIGISKERSREIKSEFEEILFKNRILDDADNQTKFDDLIDEEEISFMKKLFWEPYSKLLKLKKIFDSEISAIGPKNQALITEIILLASQFGLFEAKYSAEFLLKLIKDHLSNPGKHNLEQSEIKLLKAAEEIFEAYIKTLKIARWDNGLLHVCEKIGIETEESFGQTEKLYRLLNLEIVKILEVEKHPSADSLNLCLLSNGKRVVCGASNVHFIKDHGHSTLYAPLGSFLPNEMIISPREIRGVVSRGMLCSLEELEADCAFFQNQEQEDFEELSEMRFNKDPKASGIIVLVDSPDLKEIKGDDEERISFIGKYFSMHSWADLAITPNLGYLLGELNLSKEIENFLKFRDSEENFTSYIKEYEKYLQTEKSFGKIHPFNNLSLQYITGADQKNLSDFGSTIMISEDARHFFRNIFFFKTSQAKIHFTPNEINHLAVFNPGFNFKKENKINSLLKFFAGLYGIQLHSIKANSFKDRLVIKFALKDHTLEIHPKDFEDSSGQIKIFKQDLCAFDMSEKIVFIPGVSNSAENCAMFMGNEEEQKIIFIGFLFAHDFEKDFNFFTPQIKLAQREGINNKLTHFYQRQSSFDIENFLNFSGNEINESIYLMDQKYFENGFKKIKFDIRDLLILFRKDSKLVYGMMEKMRKNAKFKADLDLMISGGDDLIENTKRNNELLWINENSEDYEKISSFFENLYTNFVEREFDSLGFKILDDEYEDDESFKSQGENPYEKDVLIPIFRTDVNSSVDIVGALYKILNFNGKISVANDSESAFFEEMENSSAPSYEFLKKTSESLNQYDENSFFNSFETQSENPNIPLLHEGENNLNFAFYESLKKLASLGFCEVMHFSFIDDSALQNFFDLKNLVRLKSAINKTLRSLRPNLLVGLLEKYKEIIKTKKDEAILLFEQGPVFWRENPFSKVITGIMGGKKFEKNPHLPVSYFAENNHFDFFDAKSSLISALEPLNIQEDHLEFLPLDEFYKEPSNFKEFYEILVNHKFFTKDSKDPNEKFFHPLRSALVFANNPKQGNNNEEKYIFIGYCGELNPFFLEEFGLNDEGHEKIATFTIFKESFEKIYEHKSLFLSNFFHSEFQAIHRDFALVFDAHIKISQIKKNIIENSRSEPKLKNIIHQLKIFDIFQNEDLKNQGKKSVGFSFKIWSENKTFKDQEIKEITNLILEKIKNELGGVFVFEM